MAEVLVHPECGPTDSDVSIRLTGFTPWDVIRVQARLGPHEGIEMQSQIDVLADAAGRVDLATSVPLNGSYRIADPGGLIWSLRTVPWAARTPQMTRFVDASLAPYNITFTASDSAGSIASAVMRRVPLAGGIRQIELDEGGMRGTLFLPPADQRPARGFPALMTVPGSTGGIPRHLAALYAAQGWAVLALGYFGLPGLPPDLADIDLEYFLRAADWLQSNPEVHPHRLVIDGVSRGGELALLLGATSARFNAVIAWVPAAHVHRGFSKDPAKRSRGAWRLGGQNLPCVPEIAASRAPRTVDLRDGAPVTHLDDLRHIAQGEGFDLARIPVEKINGPVLLLSGRDDVMWPSASYADQVMERLKTHGFPHAAEHYAYENAGHTIGPPLAPATLSASYEGQSLQPYLYGGTPEGIARARADLWPQVRAFLQGLADVKA